MKKYKEYIKYVLLFCFSFISMSFLFSHIDGDVLWNYGFSYAISRGEIPYLDFNMVITPFYPMLMAIFLKLFSHNIFVFYLVNSFLITYMFHFLFKMYDYKAWVLFLFLIFPLPFVVFPSYNLFLLFLVILIIYLEKNKKSDYLIGVLLAISILTKQTVGVCLLLPSLYYFKDKKKILKRIVGCIIPLLLFFIYLVVTKSISPFIDLCVLGLFDFGNENGKIITIFFLLGIMMVLLLLKKILKDPKKIEYYYILAFFSILIPLFDTGHFAYFLFLYIILWLDKISFSKKTILLNISLFTISYSIIFFLFAVGYRNITYPNKYHNFEMRFLYNSSGEFIIRDHLNKYIKDNSDKKIVLLSSEAYFYKITNEMDIDYFDLLNKGNHGYNGTQKMIQRLQKFDLDNTIFIVSYDEYELDDPFDRQQINKEIMKYVIEHGTLIDEFNCFKVYKILD